MKVRYHHSSSQFLSPTPSRGFVRVGLPLLLALLLFFLLPGLLAAQEVGEALEPEAALELNDQAVAAAVAAAQPQLMDEAPPPQVLSRTLREDRLWLLPRHADLAEMLNRAGRQALQHPDCNEVLYGSLNEFKTERIGTSFTILCMKDARTTFNQVFFADDLMSEEELVAVETPEASEELERLRQMMQPSGRPGETLTPDQVSPAIVPEDLPAPVVF